MTFIETYSGKRFEPLNPNPEDICIQDIAHALSQQCRFAGHTKAFYSVAQHCVEVSLLAELWGCSPRMIVQALLHDASEAYISDVSTPLKQSTSFAAYREAEAVLQGCIYSRFGVPTKDHSLVRKADAVLLSTEARDMMPFVPEHWGALKEEPLTRHLFPWSSAEAERCFLIRFASFYGRL